MLSEAPDFRARLSRAQWDALIQNSEIVECYPDVFIFHNERVRDLAWYECEGRDFSSFPTPLRVLAVLYLLEGDVGNGGVAQYLFNHAQELKTARRYIAAFQWEELTRRLDSTIDQNKIGRRFGSWLRSLNSRFQRGVRRNLPFDETWAAFQTMYDAVDSKSFDDWYYLPETREALARELRRFISHNAAELVDLLS